MTKRHKESIQNVKKSVAVMAFDPTKKFMSRLKFVDFICKIVIWGNNFHKKPT